MTRTWEAHNHATEEILTCGSLTVLMKAIKETSVFMPENYISNWTFRFGRRAEQ